VTLFLNFNNAMSLAKLNPLYFSCMMIRSTETSNGVALSMTVGSKSKSPNRTVVLKNQNIRTNIRG
jgi:hypothetical protein